MTRLLKSSDLFSPKSDLIKKLKQKDLSSFEIIFDMYASSLYTLVVSITKNEEISNELMVKVFGSIYKSIGQFQENKSTIYIWMLGIARTIALESKPQSVDEEVNRGHSKFDSFKNINGIEQLIGQLPDDCREILILSYFRGMSSEAISKQIHKPVEEIKLCMKKGLGLLAKLIGYSSGQKAFFHAKAQRKRKGAKMN